MNEKNYLIIQGWMIKAFPDMTFQELGVYALIYGFSQDGQNEYTLGYDYVMEMCKLSRRDVAKRVVSRLVDKGYLAKSIFSLNGREFENFKAIITSKVEVSIESGEIPSKVDYKVNINNNTPNNPTLFNNKDSVISPIRGKEYDLSFVADEFKPIFTKWLDYKRAKKQTYKTSQSLKTCYNRLIDYSDNDVDVAEEIINEAIAYNYAGFFRPKNKNKKDSRPFEVRRDEFYDKVNAFLRTPEYAGEKELLYRFYNYWAQEKDGRMLWEMQPAFDIERRLRIEKTKRKN